MRVPCFLRDLRGNSLSLREVEEQTGINRAYLSRYEGGDPAKMRAALKARAVLAGAS